MLEKSFGLIFFLKKPKNEKGNLRYIYLRVTVDGVSKDIALKRKWDSQRWNASGGRAIGSKEDARELNNLLDIMCSKVYQAKKSIIDLDQALTAENLKNVLTGQGEEERTIIATFKHHNEQMKVLIGQEFAPSISTDFNKMGEEAAKAILAKETTNLRDTATVILRNSL